jgi:O-antigen/teichoic acid export membrane protein
MRSKLISALLPVTLILSNALNMLGIVVLPKIINAEEFALFSLASSIGLFIIAILFEWSRMCVMRYSVTTSDEETARRKATLNAANMWSAILLVVVAGVSQFLQTTYAAVFGMACLFAVSQALFEARQASFRAEFKDAAYIRNIVIRAVLGFVSLCAFAFFTQSAIFAMCGWAASYGLVLLLTRNPLRQPPTGEFDRATLSFLLKFGLGVTMAAVATAALSPLLRLVAAQLIPLDQSGKMMLAMDISQKIIGVLGVSINLLTLQATFRAKEFGDDKATSRRVSAQLSIVVAVVVPAVVGFAALSQSFTNLFIPTAYRDVYSQNIQWCMLAAGLIGIRAFALDSIFLVAGRSYLGITGPVATVLSSLLALLVLGSFQGYSTVVISQAMVAGALVGICVSILLGKRVLHFAIAWPDIGKVLVASMLMYGMIALVPHFGDASFLAMATGIGVIAYSLFMFGTNALGLQQMFYRTPAA